jgi:predicted nucleic acid-binding protein
MAITTAKKIFIDTNILIYFNYKDSDFHFQAVKQLNELYEKNASLYNTLIFIDHLS